MTIRGKIDWSALIIGAAVAFVEVLVLPLFQALFNVFGSISLDMDSGPILLLIIIIFMPGAFIAGYLH